MSHNFELMTQLEIEAGGNRSLHASRGRSHCHRWMLSRSSPVMPAMSAGRRCCALSSAFSCRPTGVPHARSFSAAWTMRMAAVLSASRLETLSLQTARGQFVWLTPMCDRRACRVCSDRRDDPFCGPSASSARPVCEDRRKSLVGRT